MHKCRKCKKIIPDIWSLCDACRGPRKFCRCGDEILRQWSECEACRARAGRKLAESNSDMTFAELDAMIDQQMRCLPAWWRKEIENAKATETRADCDGGGGADD